MKIQGYLILIFLFSKFHFAQEWQSPIISGYGEIMYIKDAAVQPDPNLQYNLIYDIKNDTTKNGVNKGLWVIARTLNLFYLSGVPKNKVKLVASIHGEASYIALSSAAYRKKFNKDNPNLNILKQLRSNGVDLYICSQATESRSIRKIDLNRFVVPSISGLSVLSNYQIKGYILMPI